MLLGCDRCGKSIDSVVSRNVIRFETGKLICKECHKQNKRYVSEFDLLMYLDVVCLIMGVILSVQMYISLMVNNFFQLSTYILAYVIALYVVITNWGQFIYKEAPFKSDWKTVSIPEDAPKIQRKYTIVLASFLIISVAASAFCAFYNKQYLFMIAVLIFVILLVIYSIRVYKKEKAYIESINYKKVIKE